MEDYFSSGDEYCYHDYYDDDDDRDASYGLQEIETEVPLSCTKGPSSEVITKESLLAAQREDLRRIMDLLSLKEHLARTLLIHYRWDVDKVIVVLVEKGKDKLYAEAGVTVSEHDNLSSELSSMVMCIICIEEVSASEVTTMDCGHCFCNNCWTEHFIVKINEGQSRRIRCMEYNCYAICDEAKIRSLVSARDPNLSEKFDRFLLESYIEDNKRVKWCPSVPHCGNAIRIKDDEFCEVECACGLQFCFNCLSEAHSPCSCLMWELWTKKCQDESETVNWITVHTKPCPNCHKLVHKDGGCNLVCCVCGQAFCWLCGGPTGKEHTWTSISGHSCGQYKEDQGKKTERAKMDLLRYIHYHNLFKAHTDSFKREAELKETIQEKISHLEERQSSKDFSWVTNGLDRLFRSRRVLSYSYPFAYYMFGDDSVKLEMTKEEKEIKQNLFEEQQQQLHANVEKLSLFIGEPFDQYPEDEVEELRMKIINLSVITDRLCRKLYECIENDLLDSIQLVRHRIAPYMSRGLEKASELSICWKTEA
ncbi:probable E3 ubiquitin-protein ligase ARI1 [Corylus avellana]|uniref:probable E3 ubiquitin-protein ligase ARI1 n=1 Tax=Corylus avellana TaxID=13451 RepID=UPI00286AEA85|nr:probable E3 ubiquitin-protein ligase ARI1 [Corylus avellana]